MASTQAITRLSRLMGDDTYWQSRGSQVSIQLIRDAQYRCKDGSARPYAAGTLCSWGERWVKIGLGDKLAVPRRILREDFERTWELVDPRPYYLSAP